MTHMLRALMDSQQHAITDGQCKKKEEILRKKQKEMLETETLSEKWKKKKKILMGLLYWK